MFQMDDQILQTCGIMFDNSSLNPFASRSLFYLCNIFFATYLCNILFPPIFFIFATTRLLQYCNSNGMAI